MSSFKRELNLIPKAAWIVAILIFLCMGYVLTRLMESEAAPPPLPFIILIAALGPLILAIYALAIGYIYGDARRRGMRYVMWTLLAIFIPNAIGIILYFILREPMPIHCHNCGASMTPNFAYCPRCGGSVQPACPQCRKPVEETWTNCAYCGAKLVGTPPARA